MTVKEFLSEKEEKEIVEAIKQAEKSTSGEIRVHLESHCSSDPIKRAKAVFNKLQMHKTALRNGVLFYVAIEDKKFAILGDKGINEKVPENYWKGIKAILKEHFSQGKYGNGLSICIIKTGEQLKTHFPYQADDINELSDDISYGE